MIKFKIKVKITNKKGGEKMKKWILGIIVLSIMISMISGYNKSSSNLSGYTPATGVLDTSFGNGGIVVHHNAAGGNSDDVGNSIYVDSKGKIYVTGYSENSSSNYDMVIWRYNSNGKLDTSFNGTGIVVHHNAAGGNSADIGRSIYVDSKGKIYITGFSGNGSDADMVIWRYNSNGTLDTSFGNGGIVVHNNAAGGTLRRGDEGRSIYVDSTGKIYVTGYSWSSRGIRDSRDMVIWRYNSNGTLDTSFNGTGIVVHHNAAGGYKDDEGNSIYVDTTGKIYVTGYSSNGSNYDMVIWRYNSNGTLDTSFNGTGIVVHNGVADDEGRSIYVDSTGKIYVTGYSWTSSGNYDMVIWRYNSNGTLDTSFNGTGIVVHHNAAGGNSHDEGNSIYIDTTGKIYVTGFSKNSSGNEDMVIWRYNSDGSLDTSFGNGGIVVHNNAAGGAVHDEGNSIYVDSTGKIYVTGFSWNGRNLDMVIWKYK
jgi:uncharacterized delta-60 repeat protein